MSGTIGSVGGVVRRKLSPQLTGIVGAQVDWRTEQPGGTEHLPGDGDVAITHRAAELADGRVESTELVEEVRGRQRELRVRVRGDLARAIDTDSEGHVLKFTDHAAEATGVPPSPPAGWLFHLRKLPPIEESSSRVGIAVKPRAKVRPCTESPKIGGEVGAEREGYFLAAVRIISTATSGETSLRA